MTIHRKSVLLIFSTIAIVPIVAYLAITIDMRFAFGNTLLWIPAWCLNRLKCPRCRKPIYKHQTQIGGARFTYWGLSFSGGFLFPHTCTQCGTDLTTSHSARKGHRQPKVPPFRFPDEGWRGASPQKKRVALALALGANLVGILFTLLFHDNTPLLAWQCVGAAILVGLLLSLRRK
jgi:hypothetical protein